MKPVLVTIVVLSLCVPFVAHAEEGDQLSEVSTDFCKALISDRGGQQAGWGFFCCREPL